MQRTHLLFLKYGNTVIILRVDCCSWFATCNIKFATRNIKFVIIKFIKNSSRKSVER